MCTAIFLLRLVECILISVYICLVQPPCRYHQPTLSPSVESLSFLPYIFANISSTLNKCMIVCPRLLMFQPMLVLTGSSPSTNSKGLREVPGNILLCAQISGTVTCPFPWCGIKFNVKSGIVVFDKKFIHFVYSQNII